MPNRNPYELNNKYIHDYIGSYLSKTNSKLLNVTQLNVILQLVSDCLNETLSVLWGHKLPLAIKIFESLCEICSAENDLIKEANKGFTPLLKSLEHSKYKDEFNLYICLEEFWQLCQGRLDSLKLDRIGETCEWLGVADPSLFHQRIAKGEERTRLVKQILRDFLQQAIDAAKQELALRQAETAERSADFPPPSPGLRRQP